VVKVSIIIPILVEDNDLNQCIDSLYQQQYSNYEILIVQGGNISQARNFGIKNASGKFIAFIDSDCVAPQIWLKTLISALEQNPDLSWVGGLGISPPDSDDINLAIDCIYSTYLGSLKKASKYSNIAKFKEITLVNGLSCHNSVIRKNDIIEVGLFDENFSFNEDTYLSKRLAFFNKKMAIVPNSFVWHKRRNSFIKFFKHFIVYGLNRSKIIKRNLGYLSIPLLLLFLLPFFYLGLLFMNFRLGILIAISYILYGINIGIKCKEKNNKTILIMVVPLLLFLQHIGYWIGLITGIFIKNTPIRSSKPIIYKRIIR